VADGGGPAVSEHSLIKLVIFQINIITLKVKTNYGTIGVCPLRGKGFVKDACGRQSCQSKFRSAVVEGIISIKNIGNFSFRQISEYVWLNLIQGS